MEPGTYCGFVILLDMTNGEIIALLNDGLLQHARVGATAGVGAKYLSREDSTVLGVIGSGGMAYSYTEAICEVRPIEEVRVYSPTRANRDKFAAQMTAKLGIPVNVVEDNMAVAKGADIVALCTDSREPVYDVVDKIIGNQQGKYGDFIIGSQQERDRRPSGKSYRRRYETNEYPLLANIIAGDIPGRQSDTESIYYDNNSAGLQFAAVGRVVYEKAKDAGLGMEIPMEWFQQNIRN